MTAAHLGDDTIAAMLEGGLADERAQAARAHLGSCDACRRLVSAAIDAAAPSQSASWRDGVIAGRYRIEHPLGEGGMGRVYAARQVGLERPVAIKILRPELARDTVALRRFQREARLVAQLASPHVVRVHDLGTLDSGEPYLVMELLDGEDLATLLARAPVSSEQAVAWIAAACEALGEAHALGIVHRDIKPSNLIATRTGRLVVVDFGLAKLAAPAGASAAVTADGLILGSPHYMAPEQVRGARDVDARADIWSLGATLYHLVTGRPPFPETTLQDVFTSILSGRAPVLDGVPPVIAGAIRRAMAPAPAERFQSTHELAAALRAQLPAIERFEILELLGEGSHGAVYRARQLPGGREVALKLLRVEAGRLRERFAREAQIVQRLEHPNTVRLFEHGIDARGAPYMVFELVRGRTLAAEIARGPLPEHRVARIGAQVLKALMEAHAHGVVHRDVTPANILLVDHAGEPDFVRLFDFGVASDAGGSSALTGTGQLVGTPRYMAPEQVTGGTIDARADLYALGLVMAEALSGTPVYAGESAMAVCMEQASAAPVPLPRAVTAIPLGAVIARATAKLPHARYPTAREMFDALEGTASGSRAAPEIQVQRSSTAVRNIVIGVVAVAAIGATGYVVGKATSSTREPVPTQLAAAPAAPSDAAPPTPPPTLPAATPSDAAAAAPPAPPRDAPASIQIGTKGPVEIGTRGRVEIGAKGPVVLGPNVVIKDRPPPATASQRTGGNGPLGNFDEDRLRRRLVKLGWKPSETWHENLVGCEHTRILSYFDDAHRVWADTTLLTCESRELAASEGERLRRSPSHGWVVDDGNLVLDVVSNDTVGGDEAKSKALFDKLMVP